MLYHDVSRMAGLGYPGKGSRHRNLAATETFIEALTDGKIRMRISDKEPRSLDHALQIALLAEANSESRKEDEIASKNKDYKLRTAKGKDEGGVALVTVGNGKPGESDRVEKRCDKICELMEMFLLNCAPNPQSASAVLPAPNYARPKLICYRCGAPGHFANQCTGVAEISQTPGAEVKPAIQCYGCGGLGHIGRNCPNRAIPGAKPAEQAHIVKSEDARSMIDHPVYIKAFFKRKELTFLVDTGCDRSIMPRKLIPHAPLWSADCRLYAANGTPISVMGEVMLDIRLCNEIIPTRFIVSNNVAEPMLGSDWLRKNEITWDFCNDSLSWKNKTFKLITGIEANCAIRATRRRRCIIDN